MHPSPPPSRDNQRRRTRKDLLAAAARLMKDRRGRSPSMDDVAAEALVSRATAYRYFPTIEALLVEAPIDGAVPDAAAVFAGDPPGDPPGDPAERVDRAEAALHEMCYRNEAQLRVMLAASLERSLKERGRAAGDRVPLRQNRRAGLIEAALRPARGRFTDAAYERLVASLSLVFGTESMIVCADVLGIDARAARDVKSWAVRTLVWAALEESGGEG